MRGRGSAWIGAALLVAGCTYDRSAAMGPDAAAIDAPSADVPPLDPDAAGPGLIAATAPLRIAVGEQVGLSLLVSGAPSTVVPWSVTSGGGMFQPASGTVAITGAGTGAIALDYTAPATAGDRAHTLHLTAATTVDAPFETAVRTLEPAGESAPFADNAGTTVNPNYLYGQQVSLPRDVVVMRLGLAAQLGGYAGRMALYSNVAGAPRDLVVGSALASIAVGPNELRVTPTPVPAGTYWLLGNFSATAPIKRHPTLNTGHAFVMLDTGATLPATLASSTPATNRVLNYYVLFAD